MEINYNNYALFDEQEMLKEDEKQINEIKELLVNEFADIEFEDDSDEEENNDDDIDSCNVTKDVEHLNLNNTLYEDDSRYEIESSNNNSNDKENNFQQPLNVLNSCVPNWSVAPFQPFYNVLPSVNKKNFPYRFPQTNNNCTGLDESSINWEISLHDEMGVPTSTSSNQIFSDSSKISPQFVPHENIDSHKLRITTRDVAIDCIPSNQRELDNLELLYEARGKRIEQLQFELDSEREKRIKETRIFNHKITLLESEQKNEMNSMRRANEELEQQRNTIAEYKEVIDKQNNQIIKLETNVDMLKENVQSSKIVVEGLNEQLSELTSHTAMSRNNQKQTDLLDCINRQFDTDSYRLKTEIQRMSERVDEKMREIVKLEALLDEQTENHRKQKNEWKMDIDRLIEQMDNEKEYCKTLENSINHDKIDQLNDEISDLHLGKSLAEDMNDYLQDQVTELNHQLTIYEKSLNILDNKQLVTNNNSFIEDNVRSLDNKYQLSNSCPILTITNEIFPQPHHNNIISDNKYELQKQIFLLTARTTSLSNRLLDLRKYNLDFKANLKKIQKQFDDKCHTNEILQKNMIALEKRMGEIDSGVETSLEKQLKTSIESIEIVRDNLEQQCKLLQNQLIQATESLKTSEMRYLQLEEEFFMYKKMADEDKMTSIENVKRICDNHYKNLCEQMEQSWITEKEILLNDEQCQREQLLRDLSDSVKEVDRVKNLYIQLCQQKSNEEIDRNNWNEWVEKKLDEQKRSLNQQFKKDQESIVNEMSKKHSLDLQKLKSEIKITVSKSDKCEGTMSKVLVDKICNYDKLISLDKSVQINNIIDYTDNLNEMKDQLNETKDQLNEMKDQLNEMKMLNNNLQSTLSSYQKQLSSMKKEYDSLYYSKVEMENENKSLSSLLDKYKSVTPADQFPPLSKEISECPTIIPNIIRSTTPQFVMATKKRHGILSEVETRSSNIQSQFRILKEDLIHKLSQISHSTNLLDKKFRSPCFNNLQNSGMELDNIKEQLYSFILEIQIRAANTLQIELEKSQSFIKQSLLDQIRQIIPILLSVDGQMMDIAPAKIKVLVDKLILMLDHLRDNLPSNNVNHEMINNHSSHSINSFSLTSTPLKNLCTPITPRPDIPLNFSNISLNTSTDSWSSTIPSFQNNHRYQRPTRTKLDNQCQKLKDEISQLSDALHNPDNCIITSSPKKQSTPINTDIHLFSDDDNNSLLSYHK